MTHAITPTAASGRSAKKAPITSSSKVLRPTTTKTKNNPPDRCSPDYFLVRVFHRQGYWLEQPAEGWRRRITENRMRPNQALPPTADPFTQCRDPHLRCGGQRDRNARAKPSSES